jgi:hypothetical protein
VGAWKKCTQAFLSVDHPSYTHLAALGADAVQALASDFDKGD